MSLHFSDLPRPLQDDFLASRILPVIGAGFSLNAQLDTGEMPTWTGLAKELDGELSMGGGDPLDPVDIISSYEQEHGRFYLVSRLIDLLNVGRARPGRAHTALAQAPFEHILTTNFDLLIEDALHSSRITYSPIIDESQLAIGSSNTGRILLKMHGDIHHLNRMVLTEDDYDQWLIKNPLFATEIASLFVRCTGLLVGYSLSDPDLRQILSLLTARLGRGVRPLYTIVAKATPNEIRRFERRGVRVLELLGKREHDIDGAFGMFFDEVAEAMRQSSTEEMRGKSGPISDLIGTRTAPVVFFAVPSERLRAYSELIYPEIRRMGFVPVSSNDIPVGSEPLAAVEGLIGQAAAVVAEPTTDAAVMEFTRALSTSRPLVVVAAEDGRLNEELRELNNLVAPRRPILEAQRPVSEEEWLKFTGQLSSWLRNVVGQISPPVEFEAERLLKLDEYRATVLTAYAALESRLRLLLSDDVDDGRPMGFRQLVELARSHKKLSAADYDAVIEISTLRNQVAHSDRVVTRNEARAVVEVLRRLRSALE